MKIDLSKLPTGSKWIAIDPDGDIYVFEDEPILHRADGQLQYAAQHTGTWLYEPIGNVHD